MNLVGKKIASWLKKRVLIIGLVMALFPVLRQFGNVAVQSIPEYFINSPGIVQDVFFAWSHNNFGVSSVGSLWKLFPISSIYYFFEYLLRIPSQIVQPVFLSLVVAGGYVGFVALMRQFFTVPRQREYIYVIGAICFLYNPYTLKYFASSYIDLLPYLALPAQLLFFARGLKSRRVANRQMVYFALLSAAVFGVNLVYDIIALALMAAYGLWQTLAAKEVSFWRFCGFFVGAVVLTFLLSVWWLAPFLVGSLLDKGTSSYVLSSESFYNIATTPMNLLRQLGEWGFFSSYKNIPYYSFAETYNSNWVVLTCSYLLVAAAFTAVAFRKNIASSSRSIVLFFLILVLVVLPFAGGTNKQWPTHSFFEWAFQNIPYFGALRNTYKWESVLSLSYAILIVAFLWGFAAERAKLSRAFTGALFLAIIVAGFPFWVGQLYDSKSKLVEIPSYWNEMSSYLAKNASAASSRIVVLPNQYFEVMKWDDQLRLYPGNLSADLFKIPTVHNTCSGCSSFYTSELNKFIYANIATKNIDLLLGFIGVSHILQRNDYDSEYYNVDTPAEVKRMLGDQPGAALEKTIGALDLYSIDAALVGSRFYSPKSLVEIDSLNDSLDLFSESGAQANKDAYYLSGTGGSGNFPDPRISNYYSRLFKPKETKLDSRKRLISTVELPNQNQYSLYKRSEVDFGTYDVSYRVVDGGYALRFSPDDETVAIDEKTAISKAVDSSQELRIGSGSAKIGLTINSNGYILKPTTDWTILDKIQLKRNAPAAIKTFSLNGSTKNLVPNGSFASGLWQQQAENCNNTAAAANISMKLNKGDKTHENYLTLSASDDAACTHSLPLSNYVPGATYYLSFDYKHEKGASPAFCIWDLVGCAVYGDINTGASDQWGTHETVFASTQDSKQLQLYLYASRNNFDNTTNSYDNVNAFLLQNPIFSTQFSVVDTTTFSANVELGSGKHTIAASISEKNGELLENNSFESGLWKPTVGNCSDTQSNASLQMKLAKDATNGSSSLELLANRDSACTSSANISSFRKSSDYVVSFDYKIVKGKVAGYCIWDGNTCLVYEELTGKKDQWNKFSTIVRPAEKSRSLAIFLYAPYKGGEKEQIRYDSVSIREIANKVLDSYSIRTAKKADIAPITILSAKMLNPTAHTLRIEQHAEGTLLFQESFHPGWKLCLAKQGGGGEFCLPEASHFVANGFANGWYIDPAIIPNSIKSNSGKYEARISFTPQKWFYRGLVLSGLVFFAVVGSLVYLGIRRRKVSKNSRDDEGPTPPSAPSEPVSEPPAPAPAAPSRRIGPTGPVKPLPPKKRRPLVRL